MRMMRITFWWAIRLLTIRSRYQERNFEAITFSREVVGFRPTTFERDKSGAENPTEER